MISNKPVSALSRAIDHVCLCLFSRCIISVLIRYHLFGGLLISIPLSRHFELIHVLENGDPYRCNSTLTRGRWLDTPELSSPHPPFQNWQPEGYLLHRYSASDISSCLKEQQVVFAGDSSVRQLFWAIAEELDAKRVLQEKQLANKHSDLSFEKDGVVVRFAWDPFLNSSSLSQQLYPVSRTEQDSATALLLVGGGLW